MIANKSIVESTMQNLVTNVETDISDTSRFFDFFGLQPSLPLGSPVFDENSRVMGMINNARVEQADFGQPPQLIYRALAIQPGLKHRVE